MGERLVETQLADRFQVSRTPIREAIRRLQQEKLLTDDLDGGLSVIQLSLQDVIKLYECRIALEQLAVRGVCEHATDEQIQAIEQTLEQFEALTADLQAGNQRLKLNFRFHRLLAQYSDNPWLAPILDQLSNHAILLRSQTLQTEPDIRDICAEHRQIFEAISRRDAEAATQALMHHLLVSQQRMVQLFEQNHRQAQSQERATTASLSNPSCPRCQSTQVSRNGHRLGKQNYLCRQCGRQFLEHYTSTIGYAPEMREHCITLHKNGMGFREIERTTGVNHNTVIRWVKSRQDQ